MTDAFVKIEPTEPFRFVQGWHTGTTRASHVRCVVNSSDYHTFFFQFFFVPSHTPSTTAFAWPSFDFLIIIYSNANKHHLWPMCFWHPSIIHTDTSHPPHVQAPRYHMYTGSWFFFRNRNVLVTDSERLMTYIVSDIIVAYTPVPTPHSRSSLSHVHCTQHAHPHPPHTHTPHIHSGPLVSCVSDQDSWLLLCDHY